MRSKYLTFIILFFVIFSAFEVINLKSLKRDQVDMQRTFVEISDDDETDKKQKFNEIAKFEQRILFEIKLFEVLLCVSILLLIFIVSNKFILKKMK